MKPAPTSGVIMSWRSRPVSMPSTQRRSLATSKAPSSVATSARTPAGLCAPSIDDERVARDNLHASGHSRAREGGGHDVVTERTSEKGLRRDDGGRGVDSLMNAVKRHEHLLVLGVGRAQGDGPTAESEFVLVEDELFTEQPQRRIEFARLLLGDLHDDRVGGRHTLIASARKMPTLSDAMAPTVGPSTAVWSRSTFVRTATSESMTLVESHVPPEADFDDADVDAFVREVQKRPDGQEFEAREDDAGHRLDVREPLEQRR